MMETDPKFRVTPLSDKALRQIQDRFLECLNESGFHSRVRDGMNVPLFDKESPTALQVGRELYPRYLEAFISYIKEHDARVRPQKSESRPAYFRYHGRTQADQE